MEPAFILTSVSQVCWALVWEGLVAQVFSSVADLTAMRKASTAAEPGSSQLTITACWGPPPKRHCVFLTFKTFLRVVLIYQLQALVFWPRGADKERGFYFVMRNTFLLILNFYYSQRISKHYHGVWTPHLSHLDVLDSHNLMGGVSQCISFQFILDSLKKNITDVHQTSVPHPPPALLTVDVRAHGGAFQGFGQGQGLAWALLILLLGCLASSPTQEPKAP